MINMHGEESKLAIVDADGLIGLMSKDDKHHSKATLEEFSGEQDTCVEEKVDGANMGMFLDNSGTIVAIK